MSTHVEEIDPDVDLHVAQERAEFRNKARILLVLAVGGMIGASGRYLIGLAWPTPAGGFPWSTFTINITGCIALGVLMAILGIQERPHPLARPFFGTGIIGGYTTFSTYVVETNTLFLHQHRTVGLLYLSVSITVGVALAFAGYAATDGLAPLFSRNGGRA